MKNNFNIHIYPRPAKANKQGLQPIYFCVRVNGKRWEFSTKQFINPNNWDSKNYKIKGYSIQASTINGYLNSIKTQIFNLEISYNLKVETLSLQNIKEHFDKKTESNRMLIPIFKQHNAQIEKLVNKEYAPGTLERYNTTLKHLENFLLQQYNCKDIPLTKIDHAFIMDFDFYFRTVRNCSNNTTVKYIKNFKKIINYCRANQWMNHDPFINYKVKLDKVERIFLSQEEIIKIYERVHETDRLNLVRDICGYVTSS